MLEEDAVLDAHVIPRARTSGARTVVGNVNIAIFVNVYIHIYANVSPIYLIPMFRLTLQASFINL